VSSRREYSPAALRVNSLEPRAAGCVADSILFERKLTRMKTNSFVRSMALLAAMALAVSAFAKPFAKTINISQTAKLGKSELKAGNTVCRSMEARPSSRRAGRLLPNPKADGRAQRQVRL